MAAAKGIRKGSKLANVLKSNATHTDDVAERERVTSAVAEAGKLVTPRVLMPETEDVVLAGDVNKDYLNQLAFNEEIVEITIAEDSSDFPIDPVSMSCNGKQISVARGVPTKIPRKFIECLCSPLIRVKTKKVKNNLDEDSTELELTRSLQFPFQINDPNPLGKVWLRQLLTRA